MIAHMVEHSLKRFARVAQHCYTTLLRYNSEPLVSPLYGMCNSNAQDRYVYIACVSSCMLLVQMQLALTGCR